MATPVLPCLDPVTMNVLRKSTNITFPLTPGTISNDNDDLPSTPTLDSPPYTPLLKTNRFNEIINDSTPVNSSPTFSSPPFTPLVKCPKDGSPDFSPLPSTPSLPSPPYTPMIKTKDYTPPSFDTTMYLPSPMLSSPTFTKLASSKIGNEDGYSDEYLFAPLPPTPTLSSPTFTVLLHCDNTNTYTNNLYANNTSTPPPYNPLPLPPTPTLTTPPETPMFHPQSSAMYFNPHLISPPAASPYLSAAEIEQDHQQLVQAIWKQ